MAEPLTVIEGLSSAEAEARRGRGEANVAPTTASRTYAAILRTNVFSFFNITVDGTTLDGLDDAARDRRLDAPGTRPATDAAGRRLVGGFRGRAVRACAVELLRAHQRAAAPVFTAVLPALALWFVTLSAAYRLRLLDRILGLGPLR